MGRLDEAGDHAAQSWRIRGELSPSTHPDRLDAMLLQARIALLRGDRAMADDWLARFEQTAIVDRFNVLQQARWHEVRAEFADARGNVVARIVEQRAVVAVMAQHFPGDHPLLARQRVALAALLMDGTAAERTQAHRLLEQAQEAVRPPCMRMVRPGARLPR